MPVPLVIGPAQFTLFPLVPGRSGEHRRLRAELAALEPTAIAVETDLRHAVGLRRAVAANGKLGRDEPFLPKLLRQEVARLYRGEDVDPVRAAFEYARERNVTFIPLLADAPRPGLLARWRLARAVRAIEANDEEAYAKKFWRHATHKSDFAVDAQDCAEHLADLLYRDAHPRLAVIVHHAHAETIVDEIRNRAPKRPPAEAPRETARPADDPQKRYPAWR